MDDVWQIYRLPAIGLPTDRLDNLYKKFAQ